MGNLLVVVILLAVAVGLYFLSRFAVKKTSGANWGGFVLSIGIICASIGVLMFVSSIASAVNSGRVNSLAVEMKSELNQSIEMIKQVNEKLNASVAMPEAVTLLNNTRSSFEQNNTAFFDKLKDSNLNLEEWNKVTELFTATIDNLDGIKGEYTNAVAAYLAKVKGTPAEAADMKNAADEFGKVIISFWDQLRIVGFKKSAEK